MSMPTIEPEETYLERLAVMVLGPQPTPRIWSVFLKYGIKNEALDSAVRDCWVEVVWVE